MSLIRLFLELFVLYILYKFVFEFIIPVYNTTKQMKQKMHEMHDKMQEQQGSYHKTTSHPNTPEQTRKSYSDDYIDYEEIK